MDQRDKARQSSLASNGPRQKYADHPLVKQSPVDAPGLSFITVSSSGTKPDVISQKQIRQHVMREFVRRKESDASALNKSSHKPEMPTKGAAKTSVTVRKFRIGSQEIEPFKPGRRRTVASRQYAQAESAGRMQAESGTKARQVNQSQVAMLGNGRGLAHPPSSPPTQLGSLDPFSSLPMPASHGLQELIHGHCKFSIIFRV